MDGGTDERQSGQLMRLLGERNLGIGGVRFNLAQIKIEMT